MEKIELYGLKITKDIDSKTNLPELIIEEAENQGYGIRENDVIVITSKIVSKAEGRMVKVEDIKPSRKARLFSKFFKKPPEVIELYVREGKIVGVIPVEKLSKKYGHLFEEYAKDKKTAQEIIRKDPYIFIVNVKDQLLTEGGIDFSNSPPGYCTLLPIDPDESAKRIREEIRRLQGKEIAVVITDTELKFDKFGTQDIALGASGIRPISGKFGSEDLYGKPKFGGIDDLTNLVSASANLLFGQTNEAIPVVVIRGMEYEKSEKGIKDVLYPRKAFREVLRMLIWENIKFKLISKLF